MALGMMPCSSSAIATSKPVPIVYVFPAPVCVGKDGRRVAPSTLGVPASPGPRLRPPHLPPSLGPCPAWSQSRSQQRSSTLGPQNRSCVSAALSAALSPIRQGARGSSGCGWEEAAYLPVGQHRGIVALEAALHEPAHAGRVNLLLPGVQVEHKVIGEGLVLPQEDLRLPRGDRRADVAALNLLF